MEETWELAALDMATTLPHSTHPVEKRGPSLGLCALLKAQEIGPESNFLLQTIGRDVVVLLKQLKNVLSLSL